MPSWPGAPSGLRRSSSPRAARRPAARTGTAGFVISVAGGVASFAAGDGSPYNKVAGLGFGGVPDAGVLDEIERSFAACNAPVQVELAPREAIIGAERDSAAAGCVRYAAVRNGDIVGGATMRVAEGVAQLTGAATVPAPGAGACRPRCFPPGSWRTHGDGRQARTRRCASRRSSSPASPIDGTVAELPAGPVRLADILRLLRGPTARNTAS